MASQIGAGDPLPIRDFDYHLAEIDERLRDTRILQDAWLPDARPFFYPCAYVDVLPFLRSGLTRGVYVDVAYLSPSRIRGAAFCLPARVIRQFFSDLFPGAIVTAAGNSVLRAEFVHDERRKELLFARQERSRLDRLASLLPSGAEVLFDPDLSLEGGEGVSVACRELAILAPDLAYFQSDPRERATVPPGRAGVWLREKGEERLAA